MAIDKNVEIHEVKDVENAEDFEKKHFPDLCQEDGKFYVTVGKRLEHPQTEEHLIDEINLFVNDELVGEKKLSADDTAKAEFEVEVKAGDKVYALENCNLHGVWKSNVIEVEA